MTGAASVIGRQTDGVFLIIAGVCVALLLVITALMLIFVFRYSRGRNLHPSNIEGHPLLEFSFLGASIVLVLALFNIGWKGYRQLKTEVPERALTIDVVAQQWLWTFKYEDGRTSNALNIPVNRPVRLKLNSKDVIHSLYIPAFRVKQDAVPGAEKGLWFVADKEGAYDIFCTEYCGLAHSGMLAKAVVMSEADFGAWMQTGLAAPSALAGRALEGKTIFETKGGCNACHTVDGTPLVGPTLKGVFGSKVKVSTGGKEREVTVDEKYIRQSELEPNSDVVAGFPAVMPPQKGKLTEEEISAVIEYIKTLK